jgi:hypothetical protein
LEPSSPASVTFRPPASRRSAAAQVGADRRGRQRRVPARSLWITPRSSPRGWRQSKRPKQAAPRVRRGAPLNASVERHRGRGIPDLWPAGARAPAADRECCRPSVPRGASVSRRTRAPTQRKRPSRSRTASMLSRSIRSIRPIRPSRSRGSNPRSRSTESSHSTSPTRASPYLRLYRAHREAKTPRSRRTPPKHVPACSRELPLTPATRQA